MEVGVGVLEESELSTAEVLDKIVATEEVSTRLLVPVLLVLLGMGEEIEKSSEDDVELEMIVEEEEEDVEEGATVELRRLDEELRVDEVVREDAAEEDPELQDPNAD